MHFFFFKEPLKCCDIGQVSVFAPLGEENETQRLRALLSIYVYMSKFGANAESQIRIECIKSGWECWL